MTIKTDCFLACRNAAEAAPLVAELSRSMAVGRITILLPGEADGDEGMPEGCQAVAANTVTGSDAYFNNHLLSVVCGVATTNL